MMKNEVQRNPSCKLLVFAALMAVAPVSASAMNSPSEEAIAQQNEQRVKGSVKDAKGEPVVGATVKVKGTTTATVTDVNGNFALSASPNATLEISYVGFNPKEIVINNRQNIEVTLSETSEELGEVVVTALGIVRNTRTLSYSTQSLRGSELTVNRSTTGNMLDDLRGKIAGADITTNGQIGGASKVVLRGAKSIGGGSNALIVVDGVPFQNPVLAQMGSEWGGFEGTDGMLDLNPDDIKSIDVLKGPSAAALYGSSAANGAIIITTKQGDAGHYSVSYNGGVSADLPYYMFDMQNTYGRGVGGNHVDDAGESWGAKGGCVSDNWKQVFQTGSQLNNSVSFQGGTQKVQGFASFTNNHSYGLVKNNSMNKNTVNARVNTSDIIKGLSTDLKLTYSEYKMFDVPKGDTGIGLSTYIMPRDLTIDELNNYYTIDEGTGAPVRKYWTLSSIFDSPMWLLNETGLKENRSRFIGMGSVKYQILPWLSIQGRYSYDKWMNTDYQHAANSTVGWSFQTVYEGGYYRESHNTNIEQNMDVLLSGQNHFLNDFTITYNLGASNKQGKWSYISAGSSGLSITNKFEIPFMTNTSLGGGHGKTELQSVYGTAQLNWRDALYLDVTGRNDWSSTLPSPYSYFYPSAGLTAILSDLIKMPSWISFAKIRGSWAQVGNGVGAYMLRQTYYYDATNGRVTPSSTLMNKDMKPEKTTSWEIGAEWKFLNNRLGIDLTYYNSQTKNQSIVVDQPCQSGYSSKYINCGRIDNKGIEVTLNATPIEIRNFSWSTTLNFSHNINKLKYLTEGVNKYSLGGGGRYAYCWSEVGQPIGVVYAQTWAKNENGQYLVNAKGLPIATDWQRIGQSTPRYNWGWSNTFKYDRFTLNLTIDGRIGGVLVSGTDGNLAFYGTGDFTSAHREGGWILDAVHEDGSQNTTAISAEDFWRTVGGGRNGWGGFFAYSTTNARLRNLTLSYDIPMGNQTFVKSARVSLFAHNLFFLYRGKNILKINGLKDRKCPVDPDMAFGVGSYTGFETGTLPSTRSLGLNVNITF